MASASKATPVKQLREHLQEQQEPFVLGIYLSERKYIMRSFSSHSRNYCCPINSDKNLKRPCSYDFNKKNILHATRILKSKLYKFISTHDSWELKACSKVWKDELISTTMKLTQQIAGTNEFSTSNSAITLSSSSTCNVQEDYPASEHQHDSLFAETSQPLRLGDLKKQETATDINFKWKFMEERKQINPVSVVPSNKELQEMQKDAQQFAYPEELGKVVTEQIFSWGKESRDVTNPIHRINVGFSSTLEELNYFHQLQRKIGIEIGEAIMDEIVEELIALFLY